MTDEFHRIRRLPPYVFAEVNEAKARARAAGEDIIDLGMGNPDSAHAAAHRRQAGRGGAGPAHAPLLGQQGHPRPARARSPPITRAASTWRSTPRPRWSRRSAPRRGSPTSPPRSPAPATRSWSRTRPTRSTSSASSSRAPRVRSLPATPDDEMLQRARPRGAALGAEADRADRQLPVEPDRLSGRPRFLPRDRRLLRAGTRSGSCRTWPTRRSISAIAPPPSILQVPGAKDIAVEFTSLSKTYSMPGWRMGFAAGNARLITALDAHEVVSRLRRLHADPGRRRGRAERAAGLRAADARSLPRAARRADPRPRARPAGTCRARKARCSPGRRSRRASPHLGSVEFSKLLLARAKVAVAPGIGFGEHGDGHVRIALVENTQRLRQAVRNIRAFLQAESTSRSPALAPVHA